MESKLLSLFLSLKYYRFSQSILYIFLASVLNKLPSYSLSPADLTLKYRIFDKSSGRGVSSVGISQLSWLSGWRLINDFKVSDIATSSLCLES